jgi:feruloyl-CoA synthase
LTISKNSTRDETQPVHLAKPAIHVERRNNGEFIVSSPLSLPAYPKHLGQSLQYWAEKDPDRCFLAERDANGEWRRISYSEALAASERIGHALLQRGHSANNPIGSLCDNCINMALLMLGAMHVGIPFIPVSPAYSLMSENFEKLKYIATTFTPTLLYVPSLGMFAKALKAIESLGIQIIADGRDPSFPSAESFQDLTVDPPGPAVKKHHDQINEDTIAKILLTSGSTGMPKGVINTHRMMCANGAAIDAVWPFLRDKPPIIVDWLPWNHTFGSNFNFNQIMRNGGTLYIDAGKPMPGRIEITIKNLKDVQPTLFYNVPRGFDALVPVLEQDDTFATHLFKKLDIIFFAGAALPVHLWKRLDALSIKHRGIRIPILSALGSTETAPVSTLSYWSAMESAAVGLPVPGVTLKLVPDGEKLEMRVKGENVTPGYYRADDQTSKAFDEDGFFKLGDAVKFVNENDVIAGLLFDGRVAENFKLMSGTWIHVGELRIDAISAAAPVIQDAVVTGHDREEVGLLIFPNLEGCRTIAEAPGATPAELIVQPNVIQHLKNSFETFNAHNAGTSRRITRVLVMAEPPSIDGGEITDKGYINQRAVLARRKTLVERLYADPPPSDVIVIEGHQRFTKSSV